MRLLSIALCCFIACGCGSTTYKVAPTTQKVTTKIATAKRSTHEASKRTRELETATVETHAASKTTQAHIEAAAKAIDEKNYVLAQNELVGAQASNTIVQTILGQSLRNVQTLSDSLRQTEADLGEAQGELGKVDDKIAKLATSQAKAQAIVDQVNWGFGLGAFIYGIKRILTFGFWGMLILAGVVIVLLIIGGPCAVFAMRFVKWVFSLVKRK